jgi:AraC-like DNA-binding protein
MSVKNVRVELCGLLQEPLEIQSQIETTPCFCLMQSIAGESGISIHPPNAPPKEIPEKIRALLFNMEVNNAIRAEKLFDFPKKLPSTTQERLKLLLDEVFLADNPFDRMSVAYKVAKEIIASATEREGVSNLSVCNALEYIRNNHKNRITISDLAELLRMSESNVYSSFKKQYGVSPIAYLNDYRLYVASELLSTTSYSIENVATAVGMTDMRYFSKMLKRLYNLTPSTYRKNITNEVKK